MVEYLFGGKEDFLDFLSNIGELDKVGIIADSDLDGVSSAVFLEKILGYFEISVSSLDFAREMISSEKIESYKKKGITKIFILDIPQESVDFEGLKKLEENFDVFMIDHHPFNYKYLTEKKAIKTVSADCVGWTLFNIGVEEGYLNEDEWAWLACAVAFSEFSYKKQENFELITKYYPDFKSDSLATSTPGLIARKISSALIYYNYDFNTIYTLIKERNLDKFSEALRIIEEEIDRKIETFFDNAEYFPDKKLYFYRLDSPYDIKSYLSTLLSKMKEDHTFIIYSAKVDRVSISARNQSKNPDMNLLLRNCIVGLNNAFGGGHPASSGAKINKEDIEQFKENLLKNI